MTERPLLLQRAGTLLVPPMLVVSLYLLAAGHNAPGGGFVGGLTAVLAIALSAAAGGREGMRQTIRVSPTTLLGAGLVVAGLTGTGGWILGDGFLDAGAIGVDLPLLGDVKVTSALFFDIGVYLVVAGMGAVVLDALVGDRRAS